jgi:hypothetical protein
MKKENKLQIRNSTAEFLIFTRQAGEDGIEVRVAEETVWLTQPLIAELFQTTVPNISMHLRSIYETGELTAEATLKNFLTVRQEGVWQVRKSPRSSPKASLRNTVSCRIGCLSQTSIVTSKNSWNKERLTEA